MRRRWTAPLLIALALGCGAEPGPDGGAASEDSGVENLPPSIPAPEVEAGILIATPERVREWQQDSVPFILIDARDSVQFAQEHIPGAVQISYVDIRPGTRPMSPRPRSSRAVSSAISASFYTRAGYGT